MGFTRKEKIDVRFFKNDKEAIEYLSKKVHGDIQWDLNYGNGVYMADNKVDTEEDINKILTAVIKKTNIPKIPRVTRLNINSDFLRCPWFPANYNYKLSTSINHFGTGIDTKEQKTVTKVYEKKVYTNYSIG